jgi:hypothetical protein
LLTEASEIVSCRVVNGVKIWGKIGLAVMVDDELLPRGGGGKLGGQYRN